MLFFGQPRMRCTYGCSVSTGTTQNWSASSGFFPRKSCHGPTVCAAGRPATGLRPAGVFCGRSWEAISGVLPNRSASPPVSTANRYIADGGERSRLCFNLSHTGGEAIVALAAQREIGVDLETGPRQSAVRGNGAALLFRLRTGRPVQPAGRRNSWPPFSAAGPVRKPISRHAAPASANPPTASQSPFSPACHRHLPGMQPLRESLSGGNWSTWKFLKNFVPRWPSKAMEWWSVIFPTCSRQLAGPI